MHRCQHSLNKITSNRWVVCIESISLQEISYAGKPQVVSKYILSNLWVEHLTFNLTIEGLNPATAGEW
jgi:hypothetical protein